MSDHPIETRASRLFVRTLGPTVSTVLLLWVSTLLALVAVGFALYPAACVYQVRKHFESAFGAGHYRQSLTPYWLILLLVPTTLAIGVWAIVLISQYTSPIWDTMLPWAAAHEDLMNVGVLALVFIASGWVIAPLLLMIPLAMDPSAGDDQRARSSAAIALSLTSELSPWRRLGALCIAAFALLAPVAFMSSGPLPGEALLAFAMLSAFFVPVASALLVALYARVRPRIEGLRGELPAIPSGLALLTLAVLALVLAGVTSAHRHPFASVLACCLAFLCMHGWLNLLRVSRLRVLNTLSEGVPGGRHAATGHVRGDALDVGFARIPLDPNWLGDLREGDEATLIADFRPILPSLRGTTPERPKDAQLFAGTLENVIRTRTRRAVLAAYGWVLATGIVGLYAVS